MLSGLLLTTHKKNQTKKTAVAERGALWEEVKRLDGPETEGMPPHNTNQGQVYCLNGK